MHDVAVLEIEFYMVLQTGIQPKACSIKVHVNPTARLLEILEKLCCYIVRVCAIVRHTVFMVQMGLRGKKFAAQKIVVKYFSFLGGDSRPLASKN